MKIGILGTGVVGDAIGSKLLSLGHEVMMGSRTSSHEKSSAFLAKHNERASAGTFAETASFGELVFNCTSGLASINALTMAGENNLNGKILVDISNPLDFSKGFPPTLSVCNSNSLGEEIQKTFPGARVVKTLNTMNCNVMVNPEMIGEADHHVFLSGNDDEAKTQISNLLQTFGWPEKNILDLGDITTARGTEMWLPLWVRIYGATKNGVFNIKIVS